MKTGFYPDHHKFGLADIFEINPERRAILMEKAKFRS
jgi:hypothetical protein